MSANSSYTYRDDFSFANYVSEFQRLSIKFEKYHKDPYNVLVHVVTTTIGVIGALCLLRKISGSSSYGVTLMVLYLISLTPVLNSLEILMGTSALVLIILGIVRKVDVGIISSVGLIILGYVLQDLSHLATGELTYQSTYSGGAGAHVDFKNPLAWLSLFTEHVYYLLPLVVSIARPFLPASLHQFDVSIPSSLVHIYEYVWGIGPLLVVVIGGYCLDSMNGFCFFPGFPYHNRVVVGNIAYPKDGQESRKQDLANIREWTLGQNPPLDKSSHWWCKDLPAPVQQSFVRCAKSDVINSIFRKLFSEKHYCMEVVDGMNEIYVTGPARLDQGQNSDQVFYSRHVDGPWGLLPFVSVFRCIVGMDKNMMITTHFPLANLSVNACEGDVLAFDFNREVHYITQDESKKSISDEYRVTLKLHYCIYPRILAPLGWLMHAINVRYNIAFRALFLKTITPSSLYEHFLAWNVTFSTSMFNFIETFLGQRNLLYIALAGILWYTTGVYTVFLVMTSFVHYIRYITTFYVRRGIDFGSFKRDVLLFKTLALTQLFLLYFFPTSQPFLWDPISVALIVTGYSLSALATHALGIDRTYFAAELGLVPPKWIDCFPYGYIPHPMILSQVLALLGLYKSAAFRADWPVLIPIHVSLYLIHMLQEHFDIYRTYSSSKDDGAVISGTGLATGVSSLGGLILVGDKVKSL